MTMTRFAAIAVGAVAFGCPVTLAQEEERPMSDTPTLRVLSYNIHHGEGTDGKFDLERLAEVIRSARPDLVALQEVDRETERSGGIDQAAVLGELTGLHHTFGQARPYQGGDYGQAILSRFPISDAKVHVLPSKLEVEPRIITETTVDIEGAKLVFLCTHLQHDDAAMREAQASKIVELFGDTKLPLILAGDFNAEQDSRPLEILSERLTIATADRSLRTFPATDPSKQIDFILYRPGDRFRTVEAMVIDEKVASDHRPVLALVEWKGQ